MLQKNNGPLLAQRPPMGWNSYNTFGCEPEESLLLEIADALVEEGFKKAGYDYINIDDGWMAKERDAKGQLIPHPEKFPNGLNKITDYIHDKGLKAGIYLGAGIRTYGEYPGSLGYEKIDARSIAQWGFDLLKYDYRELPEDPPRGTVEEEYTQMRDYLLETGRPILFSICEHGRSNPWEWGPKVGHIWRTSPDIKDGFDGQITWGWGFKKIIDETWQLHGHAGPGAWNDPDMLIVGLNGQLDWQGKGCTMEEYKSHFALWCLSAAPLLMGCDIRNLDQDSKDILLNKNLIAINQDSLGRQGYVVHRDTQEDIWIKPLMGEAMAVGIFNHGPQTRSLRLDWHKMGISRDTEFRVEESWTGEDWGTQSREMEVSVPSHGTAVFRFQRLVTTDKRTQENQGVPGGSSSEEE